MGSKNKGGLKVGRLGSGDKSKNNLGKQDGKGRANITPKSGTAKVKTGDFSAGG